MPTPGRSEKIENERVRALPASSALPTIDRVPILSYASADTLRLLRRLRLRLREAPSAVLAIVPSQDTIFTIDQGHFPNSKLDFSDQRPTAAVPKEVSG